MERRIETNIEPNYSESVLVRLAEQYVTRYLNNNLPPIFTYHNIVHTKRVVEKVDLLSEKLGLLEKEREYLLIAAWFHDTGIYKNIENHENESSKIAEEFLTVNKASSGTIKEVSTLILATKIDHKPQNLIEGILRDADSSHLADKNYDECTSLLRKEWELTLGKNFTNTEWLEENILFLTNHKFYSDYAYTNWEERKGKNLANLLQSQNKDWQETRKFDQKKGELEFKKNKKDLPDRGVETVFRVALRNHITLSDIADTKANILLSVNAIIISVALSNLLPKLDNPSNTYLVYPTVIFLLFTVTSIVLSVLATRPNVTKGTFTKEDVAQKKVNLVFFGNFHQMSLKDFEWGMGQLLKDKQYLYGSLTKDLYFLGLVLNRKYALLRTTYSVFMVGIVVSVIAFLIAFVIAG